MAERQKESLLINLNFVVYPCSLPLAFRNCKQHLKMSLKLKVYFIQIVVCVTTTQSTTFMKFSKIDFAPIWINSFYKSQSPSNKPSLMECAALCAIDNQPICQFFILDRERDKKSRSILVCCISKSHGIVHNTIS